MYGMTNGYYLSIDPDFPYINSSTIYLISQQWNGLNLISNDLDFNIIKFNLILPGQAVLGIQVSEHTLTNAPNLQNGFGGLLMTM